MPSPMGISGFSVLLPPTQAQARTPARPPRLHSDGGRLGELHPYQRRALSFAFFVLRSGAAQNKIAGKTGALLPPRCIRRCKRWERGWDILTRVFHVVVTVLAAPPALRVRQIRRLFWSSRAGRTLVHHSGDRLPVCAHHAEGYGR